MKLSEIFSQLTSGELSQLAVGGAEQGKIQDKDYRKILDHVNQGLMDLHSRFTIREGRLVIALQPGKGSYLLTSDFALTSRKSREATRYILDSPEEPFLDDIIKVERVLTDASYELALNMTGNKESLTTPSETVLRLPKVMAGGGAFGDVPDYLKTSQLEVFYRATHPLIVKALGYFDPSRVNVALPRVYLQALLYYVASRLHAPVGMNQEFYSGTIYGQKYEQECSRLLVTGVELSAHRQNTRAERAGWV